MIVENVTWPNDGFPAYGVGAVMMLAQLCDWYIAPAIIYKMIFSHELQNATTLYVKKNQTHWLPDKSSAMAM